MGLFLFVRWLHSFLLTVLGFAAFAVYGTHGIAAGALVGASLVLGLVFTAGYYVLVERLITRFRRLVPQLVSIYDPHFWWQERLWKVPVGFLVVFNGTPFKNLLWRLLGVRIGRRVFDDGVSITERTLTTIGDDCTLGAHSKIQAHSQEDGTYKSDHIVLGAGVTLGTGALVHYGVSMGDGSQLAPDSFLMKGEDVPCLARWGGNPAVALRSDQIAPAGTARPERPDRTHHRHHRHRTDFDGGSPMNTIPRWTPGPVPGDDPQDGRHPVYAEYEVPLDASLLRSASFESALLAAHAKVLAALSGEREVTTGYVAVKGGRPVPRRMLVGPGSWRELLALTDLADEVGAADEPPYETVLDPHGGSPARRRRRRVVLHLSVGERTLRLRHRTDVLDTGAAARIAGYHLTALSLIDRRPGRRPRVAEPAVGRRTRLPAGRVGGPGP